MLITCFALFGTACRINKDWRDVEEKLIDENYEVQATTSETYIEYYLEDFNLDDFAKDVECVMMAEKGSKCIFIVFCEDRATAKDIKSEAEDMVEDVADMMDIDEDDLKLGRDGKVVYLGHKDAVKAAK